MYGHRYSSSPTHAGFTLLEMIIILMVVGILAAVAFVRQPGDEITLNSQIIRLAEDIRYTQALAMQRGQRTRINFSTTTYAISDLTNTSKYRHPAETTPVISLPPGFNLTASQSFLVFNSAGIPYMDARLPGTPLATNVTLSLTAPDGSSRALLIHPETGKVTT